MQVAFNGPTADDARGCRRAGRRIPTWRRCRCRPRTIPARDFSLVDVNAAGATKGGALAAVAAHFGVARDEVFAIGDNHNDLDMLQWAGTGVVMGNAEPEVLALGLPIAPTNDEAGLAERSAIRARDSG